MTDTVKVALDDDYYSREQWADYPNGNADLYEQNDVYEISREQRDRWQQAMDAYEEMQDEIRDLLKQRQEQRTAERAESERRRQAREALLIRPWRKP